LWPRPAGAEARDPLESPCQVRLDAFVTPPLQSVGQPVNVKTVLRFACPEQRRDYHLALVVDAAAVGARGPAAWAAPEIERLADRFDLAENPGAEVGVVGFDGASRWSCAPSAEPADLAACLERLGLPAGPAPGPAELAAAIRDASKALLLSRDPARPAGEGLLVLGRGDPVPRCPSHALCADDADACSPVGNAVAEAAARGIETTAVCLTGACSGSCLGDLAEPTLVFPSGRLGAALAEAEGRIWATELRVRSVQLREVLSAGFDLVPSTLDGPFPEHDAARRRLTWHTEGPRQEPLRLSYSLVPRAAGRWPVRLASFGTFVDTDGRAQSFALPHTGVGVAAGPILRVLLPFLQAEVVSVHP
jgi:hypothetical protein